MGGEEFLVVCPETDMAGVAALAEKLRELIANHVSPTVGTTTGSFGVASLHSGESIESLIGRADAALYKAKSSGRNRVAIAV